MGALSQYMYFLQDSVGVKVRLALNGAGQDVGMVCNGTVVSFLSNWFSRVPSLHVHPENFFVT